MTLKTSFKISDTVVVAHSDAFTASKIVSNLRIWNMPASVLRYVERNSILSKTFGSPTGWSIMHGRFVSVGGGFPISFKQTFYDINHYSRSVVNSNFPV